MKRELTGVVFALSLIGCPAETPQAVTPEASASEGSGDLDAIFATSDLPDPVPAPLAGDPLGVTVHRLSNGLTVYISTDRSKPRFDAWIAVRTGGRNDPPDSTGLAHYLEHMLFKGSDELGTMAMDRERAHVDEVARLYDQLRGADDAKRAEVLRSIDTETQAMAKLAIPNEFDNLYATLGIEGVNAFTNEDATIYICNAPSNRLEAWAKVEAERFQDPVFRLFYPELEAVYEEKNRSLDNPGWRMSEALAKALFPEHPYGTQTVIGEVEHLKTPAYGDMVEYFERWYRPNNVAIVLAGDIDPATAIPVLERHFASWQPAPMRPPTPGRVVPLAGRQFTEITAKGEQSVEIAWLTAPAGHADQAALEVMDLLVNNSATGLLDLHLLLTQKLPEGHSNQNAQHEAGYWTLSGTAREGQTPEEVEALLMQIVGKLTRGDFSDDDLAAVKLNLEIQRKLALEDSGSRVDLLTESFIFHRPWADAARDLERTRAVTRDDVLRVAKAYLGEGRAVVYRRAGEYTPPRIAKPEITPLEIDSKRESDFARAVRSLPSTELSPEWAVQGRHYQRSRIATGELLTVENPRNDLFTLEYTFEEGSRRRPLLCHALEMLERSGAGELDATALRRRAYSWGTSASFSCSADQVRIVINGIDGRLEDSVMLTREWLASPHVEDDLLAGLLENTLSLRKDSLENAHQLAAALGEYAAYGKKSRYLAIPSDRELRAATAKQLRAELRRLLELEHDTAYFGPRKLDEIKDKVVIGTAKLTEQPRVARTHVAHRGPRLYFLHKEMAQAQIRIEVASGTTADSEYARSEVLGDYLGGGMGGLVFQEMREARGLAYSANAYHSRGARPIDDSALIASIGTQADKAVTSVTVMQDLLHGAIQPNRLARAKETVDQGYRASRIDPRALARWVESWDELGEPEDPRPRHWAKSQALELAELQAWMDELAERDVIVTVLGDETRVDLAGLEKLFGKAIRVRREQVFGY